GKNNSSITVELFQHAFKQPSVVAKILGKGPQSDELVILGAHEDSINLWGNLIDVEDKRAPGADDDASGVATLLETFRVIVESGFQPNRTLVFMTYAGEEVGLLGSLDIAKNYKGQNKKIAGVLQFDMTMFPGTSHKLTFINDHVDTKLTKFVEGLVDQYIKVPWTESSCGYACSDHASWTRYGYPSAFPFEAPFDEYNKKIHTSGDTLDNNLDILFGSYFAKLSLAFAVELAQAGL
ncbi:MAG: M20/M25/M40 family metallo-hydrolase, partial [Deltaproteobacteria bacterium]|nr:M20/M25/M40 family metallo-hydrolase [Deltaproteobacteria bacterium]